MFDSLKQLLQPLVAFHWYHEEIKVPLGEKMVQQYTRENICC